MLHSQYTRRRTADSFHEDDNQMEEKIQDDWSWKFFIGFIIVQVTARSVWVSLGVILSFIVKDSQSFWGFFWTPLLYTVIWIISEPWIKKICEKINSPIELMYGVVLGLATTWFGLIIAVKCPLTSSHLLPLLGVAGGLGTSFAVTGSADLLKKQFPNRSGALRSFNQSVAAFSCLAMPIASFFVMDNFGDHGGLLIHAGILMQGFVGGILLKYANWPRNENQKDDRSQKYTKVNQTPEIWTEPDLKEDFLELESHYWRNPATETPKPVQVENQPPKEKPQRHRIFPVKTKKCNAFGVEIMPSIIEVNDESNSQSEDVEQDCSDLKKSIEELYKLSCDIVDNRQMVVNALKKPPRTFEHYKRKSDEIERTEDDEKITVEDVRTSEQERTCSCENQSEEVKLLITKSEEDDEKVIEIKNSDLDSETGERKQTEVNDANNGDVVQGLPEEEILPQNEPTEKRTQNEEENRNNFLEWIQDLRSLSCYLLFYARHVLINIPIRNLYLGEPMLLPAILLSYTIQFSFLGFICITPTVINRYIEDSTEEESAFTVSLTGFTWLCFVIASPCFSTIHFTNHQFICIAALAASSFSFYLLSESTTQDETALYASLYGICHGITLMTSHSILKMAFHGSKQLNAMQPCITTIVAILMTLSTYLMSVTPLLNDLRNCYKLFAAVQGLSACVWTVLGCVTSVRARRGRLGITWSRRRRVS